MRHATTGQYPVLVLLMWFSDYAETALPTRVQIQALYNGERNIDPAVPLAMHVIMGVAVALDVTATVTPWIDLHHPAVQYASDLYNVGR